MSEAMTQLHEEHRNIARILKALERQLEIFERGEHPDYDILSAVADYFLGFPDSCHHPKEDLILRKLRETDADAAHGVADLEAEHRRIGELARNFDAALQNVLQEAEVPRSAFVEVAKAFVTEQRRHMEMEDAHFFPLVERTLSAEDWADIDAEMSRETDPLFDSATAQQFAALRDDIAAWEREDGVAGG